MEVCNFCSKLFSNKVNLLQHQKTVKSCLLLQGKTEEETSIECKNCKKLLTLKYYKHHKIKCDAEKEENNKKKILEEIYNKNKNLEKENKKLKSQLNEFAENNKILKIKNVELEKQIEKLESINDILEKQIEKLHNMSENITMKLADKVNVTNNNVKTVVVNNPPLTNEVLRQCAETFDINNAYNINGIARHFTTSLEDHISCTDPSRSIFKYRNDKKEEIIDQDLEILLPQYLTVIRDRNNFLYKEVLDYFKKNNVPVESQTDYALFYNALNNIIEKSGYQNKYSERYKQYMVRECKRRFLDKNKNKDKTITKKLTVDEIMTNIIETGGSVSDFTSILFPYNEDETEEEIIKRRELEDIFIKKKREWKESSP